MRILVLTEHFLPAVGGSITWLVNTYSRYCPSNTVVIASRHSASGLIDHKLPFRVERIAMTMADWDPTSTIIIDPLSSNNPCTFLDAAFVTVFNKFTVLRFYRRDLSLSS